jgi:hypothetical protein
MVAVVTTHSLLSDGACEMKIDVRQGTATIRTKYQASGRPSVHNCSLKNQKVHEGSVKLGNRSLERAPGVGSA